MKKLSIVIFLIAVLTLSSFSSVLAMDYQEAPVLEEKVGNGELPALEDRLPENPLVLEPRESIGEYGGAIRGVQDRFFTHFLYEPLVMKNYYGNNEYKANLAEEWEVSEDYTTYTFKLRKGLKWSDGHPLTAEDFRYWLEHEIKNENLEPIAVPDWLKADGQAVELETPDEYTLVFKFAAPKPDFLAATTASMSHSGGITNISPAHYMKKFHPEFADEDNLTKKIDEAGLDQWYELYENVKNVLDNQERPVIYPWKITTDAVSDKLQIAERNAYYWKVDPDGKQLPYADQLKWTDIGEVDVRLMKAMNGEVDIAELSNRTSDIPVLKQNEEEGNYRTTLINLSFLNGASLVYYFNQNYDLVAEDETDKEMAKLLKNPKFRRALSYATDREEINEFVNLGLAKIRQAVLNDAHPASSREISSRYTEYNPEKANELLDEIGLVEKNEKGIRLLPNGEPVTIILSPAASKEFRVDAATVTKPQWEKVGVRTLVRPEEWSLFKEKREEGSFQVVVTGNSAGFTALGGKAPYFYPVMGWSYFAPLNGRYYSSDGSEGVEAEGKMKELIDLYEEAKGTLSEEKQNEILRETMEMHVENLWGIGITGYAPWAGVVHNRLHNVPEEFRSAGAYPIYQYPEQYYISE
jgi:peptide/nickel transport system substrate-binding protein